MEEAIVTVPCAHHDAWPAIGFCGQEPVETSDPPADATDAAPTDTGETSTDGEDVYAMEGSVTIAYPEGETAEIQPVLEAFRAQYPNIEVVEEPFPGSTGGVPCSDGGRQQHARPDVA